MRRERLLAARAGFGAIQVLFLLIALGASGRQGRAEQVQWSSGGPSGNIVLAIDPRTPTTIYAGTIGGIYKSGDGGESWTSVFRATSPVQALAIDPQTPATVYAALYSGGIYKTIDSGVNWAQSITGLPATLTITSLVIDPVTPAKLYLGTNDGVFLSIDNGANWTAGGNLSWIGGKVVVRSLAIDPKTPSILYAGTVGDVYKSTNGGRSWNNSLSGFEEQSALALAVDPLTPSTLYAATVNGIYKSLDGGLYWSASNSDLPGRSAVVVVDPQSPSIVYTGINLHGFYKSNDAGGNWTASSAGLSDEPVVRSLVIDPQTPSTLYAGINNASVYKSVDGGAHWTLSTYSLTGPVNVIVPNSLDAAIFAGTTDGIYKSVDGALSWNPSSKGIPATSMISTAAVDPKTPAKIYLGMVGGGIHKSTDTGASWTHVALPTYQPVLALAVNPGTPTTLFAGTGGGGLYQSLDSGDTWTGTGIPANSAVYSILFNPKNTTILYVGTSLGLYQSVDSGSTWKRIGNGLPETPILSLAIDPQLPDILFAGTLGQGIFKSHTQGAWWNPASTGIPMEAEIWNLVINPLNPTILYATTSQGLFQSTNGGGIWSLLMTGNSRGLALSAKDPFTVYVGQGDGTVWVQRPSTCYYALSAYSANYTSSGFSSGQINVYTMGGGGCYWTAVSNHDWITITAGKSGSGNGAVTISVAANSDTAVRTGTLTIAGGTFTITQEAAGSALAISSVTPNAGSIQGSPEITITGSGFRVGASVAIGGSYATITSLTSSLITALPGGAPAAGTYNVVVTNPGGTSAVLQNSFTFEESTTPIFKRVFVPIVLSSPGLGGSYYTSEMTLTNRGSRTISIELVYTSSIGSGSGTAFDHLGPGQQKIVPDAIQYLRSLGIPISSASAQGGTLLVTFSGLVSTSDAGATVRTTTRVPEGRAGLSYAGIPTQTPLVGPSYICGLRQDGSDRSNVALQNMGTAADGAITLRVTVFSGYEGPAYFHVLPDIVLQGGGFVQLAEVLHSGGWSFENGYVRVERVGGSAPYFAYGVINDQFNSDGSFVVPIPESLLAGKTRLSLPVVVEASVYSTELVIANWSSSAKTLNCKYISENITTSDNSAAFTLTINPGQQRIIPNLVQWLRDSQISGIGAAGPILAGALFVSVSSGDLNGVFVAGRTLNPGGGGNYGLFYAAAPEGTVSVNEAWIYGLQQNSETRSNLALVNTGNADTNADTFQINLYDGTTGNLVNTIENISLGAYRWKQFDSILATYAPTTTQGYARITRTGGTNPFLAYAVLNDGGQPGQRSGDGSFVTSVP